MPIRAIAFDLDDTLLRPDNSISPYTVDVLRRAHESGVRILPASGRTFGSMMKAVPPLNELFKQAGMELPELLGKDMTAEEPDFVEAETVEDTEQE